ncbi:MAG: bifunctional GTP diphosphokinase/guanosine-3',5'-bis pyrophosphate 3'-pyrophosphohydrolase [Gammaproteobacteria bacterium]
MAKAVTSAPAARTIDDPTRFQVGNLCAILETYLEPAQIERVHRAYLFGAQAHEGQTRLTGEPYIYHPLAVAHTMADMRMDADSIIAGILHDVIEDTPTAKEQLAREFGRDVAELVDGVSKLTHLKFESRAVAQAENFRKMMLAMVNDLRVIMVKLADRLHNMRTLQVMPPEKRRRIARETLEIYAPIAQRLGMNTLRGELEQLGFEALYPNRYRLLDSAVKRSRGNRKELLAKIETTLRKRLQEVGIESRVFGREKSLYSIYKKMRQKHLSFNQVFDVFALRLVVKEVDTCYRALGVIHNLYKPVPGRFKDYIAIPKVNGYQSLHTVLFGPHGIPIETQIRTEEMDRVACAGIAAHWLYKSADSSSLKAHARAHQWLKEVLEIQQSAGNSLEFLEGVKADLFPDEVYVFTPAGEIRELPRGATAVDYAYSVHSDVGNTCVAVKIDRRLAPLSSALQNGQTVEVITAPSARPNPIWLNFVVTAKARANIRHFLKNQQHEEAVRLGRRLLETALATYRLDMDSLGHKCIRRLLKDIGLDSLDALLKDIGLGNRMAQLVARRLIDTGDKLPPGERRCDADLPLAIQGTEGMVVSFGKCCLPIPGDPIVGVMSAGRGLVIHRDSCRNVAVHRDKPDKWIHVFWSAEPTGEFATAIRVQSANQRGVLAALAAKISDEGSNIENVSFEERDGVTTTIIFVLAVHNRRHLARIMRIVRSTPEVYKVQRARG